MSAAPSNAADQATQITQYGITWTFDHPCSTGHFVNGDPWVIGPVTVVAVTPAPAPAGTDEPALTAASRYGAAALKPDRTLRNGSMLNPQPGVQQGYDSRLLNYNPSLSATFPLTLQPGASLVSTTSFTSTELDKKGVPQLATPFLLGQLKFPLTTPTLSLALRSAAVLTCVTSAPPDDAFRPPYTGGEERIYRAKDLQWNLLPKLKPVAATPAWSDMERIFERPWLDHDGSWLIQFTGPGENQPNYGREFCRLTSMASLMLMLDVPDEQKRKLLTEYVQLGIDLSGLAKHGRQWFSDGGHWQGRKWPILFASLMLGDESLRDFPQVAPGSTLYGHIKLDPTAASTTTLFQEDLDSYYGQGGNEQSVLWQIVYHTQPRAPYQEAARSTFGKAEKFVDGYQQNNAASWAGAALAAQLMKAKAIWNHDAFFDYIDLWMSPNVPFEFPAWMPKASPRLFDPFVQQMWDAHRKDIPPQPLGRDNLKWVYTDGKQTAQGFSATMGKWVANDRPASAAGAQ